MTNKMFIDKLSGEAYGLRALNYYYLLMAHGGWTEDGKLLGVPMLLEPESTTSDFNQHVLLLVSVYSKFLKI